MVDDKFIMMGIDDERSKDIAEVLGNKTCKKIIDYLAETKEASEKDISDALNIPINTVEYNLNKLIKAGLVEKAKNFFWSRKGRKIDMFRLANKHIIISPKKSKPTMDQLKTLLPIFFIGIFALLLIATLTLYPKETKLKSSEEILKKFASYEELENFINAASNNNNYYAYAEEGALQKSVDAPAMERFDSDASTTSAGGSASSYSKTNVQVEGIDEPDIVKNDGKYIYTLSNGKVTIIDAFPPENMKILTEINETNAMNMFIYENNLIIFSNSYESVPYAKSSCLYGMRCPSYSTQKTQISIFDISTKENPVLKTNFSIEGNYNDARLINNFVYLVSSKYANSPEPPVYSIDSAITLILPTDVYYFNYPDNSYSFTTITALDIDSEQINSEVYLTGQTGTIYVSEKNIYLTYLKQMDYKNYSIEYAYKIGIELLPDKKSEIESLVSKDLPAYSLINQINNLIYSHSQSLKGLEKSEFDKKFNQLLNTFEEDLRKESEKTAIHKISINKDLIKYKTAGEVPGRILNQFSMDEYDNDFRIATTTGETWNQNSLNHVYILDEDLKIIGKVEDLAKGERIYSARFVKDKAYMVTFRQIDPLFVIDLDRNNPKVLGYLKIPGYSDYLHPYDENHIIGIGKDTAEVSRSENDIALYQGMKISLFDISDFENPVEKAKYLIGDRGTDSPILYDHKALLFDKEKNLLVFPVSVAEINRSKYKTPCKNEYDYDCLSPYTYGETVWQGAYVFNINSENISLSGKISHFTEKQRLKPAEQEPIGAERLDWSGNTWKKIYNNPGGRNWKMTESRYQGSETIMYEDYIIDSMPKGSEYKEYFDYKTQIQRSLIMDDYLYTISPTKVKANELSSMNELNSVTITYNEYSYPYPVMYDF